MAVGKILREGKKEPRGARHAQYPASAGPHDWNRGGSANQASSGVTATAYTGLSVAVTLRVTSP
jgi:hypothetical protein